MPRVGGLVTCRHVTLDVSARASDQTVDLVSKFPAKSSKHHRICALQHLYPSACVQRNPQITLYLDLRTLLHAVLAKYTVLERFLNCPIGHIISTLSVPNHHLHIYTGSWSS